MLSYLFSTSFAINSYNCEMLKSLFFFLLFTVLCTPAYAKLYSYSELEIKGYDELNKMVLELIQKAEQIDIQAQKEASVADYDNTESLELLKEALRLIFSRPNKDNMIEKLLPPLRAELKSYNAFYDSLNDLVVEAVAGLNQKISVVYKSTFIFILENFMSEFRPLLKTDEEIKKIFIYIKDSKAAVPDDVRLDRKLRSMSTSRNPSETAESILKMDFPPSQQKKDKKSFWQRLFD